VIFSPSFSSPSPFFFSSMDTSLVFVVSFSFKDWIGIASPVRDDPRVLVREEADPPPSALEADSPVVAVPLSRLHVSPSF